MDKKKILSGLLSMVLLISVSIAVGVTGAAILHSMQLENPIKTSTVEGVITENLDQGAKEVSFTNHGEADVFLRVAFAQSWVTADGRVLPNVIEDEPGRFLPVANPDLAVHFNWEDGKDGWYYYKKVLPGSSSGEDRHSTENLVRSVEFKDLTKLKDQRYQDAEYQLHFTMEIVQCSDDWEVSSQAVKMLFDRDISLEQNKDDWDDNKYECIINWNSD